MKIELQNLVARYKNIKRDKNGRFVGGSGGIRFPKDFNWRRALPVILVVALVGGYLVWQSFAATSVTPPNWKLYWSDEISLALALLVAGMLLLRFITLHSHATKFVPKYHMLKGCGLHFGFGTLVVLVLLKLMLWNIFTLKFLARLPKLCTYLKKLAVILQRSRVHLRQLVLVLPI